MTYHLRMLQDPHRMVAYERAIRHLVSPGDVVLDVGTGTGVLAMFAARAGARVHAVESQPVVEIGRELAEQNGLSQSIEFHRCDIRELQVAEPVDLIVSDFMGRFVIDDCMQQAMRAAVEWLKPNGRICPERVTLRLAPVNIDHFAPLDGMTRCHLGLDFGALTERMTHEAYGINLPAGQLLSHAQTFATLNPRALTADSWCNPLQFKIARPGRLRGVAGWFEASLCGEISLSTEPGIQSHWGQLLFPVPDTRVEPGDEVDFNLIIDDGQEAEDWRWSGEVRSQQSGTRPFSRGNPGPESRVPKNQPQPPDGQTASDTVSGAVGAIEISQLNEAGIAAFAQADMQAAEDAFAAAISRLPLGQGQGMQAAELYENLGLAYINSSAYLPAITAFLRALDGNPASREQSARFLVDACFHGQRHDDGQRFLNDYEAEFGPHPSGWRQPESD